MTMSPGAAAAQARTQGQGGSRAQPGCGEGPGGVAERKERAPSHKAATQPLASFVQLPI